MVAFGGHHLDQELLDLVRFLQQHQHHRLLLNYVQHLVHMPHLQQNLELELLEEYFLLHLFLFLDHNQFQRHQNHQLHLDHDK